jgi:hypothetical protein
MDFTDIPTPILVKTWNNLTQGLDKVAKSLEDGTFHETGAKGAASPAQAGQMTLWFMFAVDQELVKRGVTSHRA